jgi:hypothetical protein
MMLLGLLLGAALSSYMYLHPKALGFSFPSIHGELAVRPTFGRILIYLLGRWLGYGLLGILFGWLGSWLVNPVWDRLAISAAGFFGIFMLLFVVMVNSPECPIGLWSDPGQTSLPLFTKGLLSTGIVLAPTVIGGCYTIVEYQGFSGGIFFTYFFIGNALLGLPMLLNMKWTKNVGFRFFLRTLMLICGGGVLYLSIQLLAKF